MALFLWLIIPEDEKPEFICEICTKTEAYFPLYGRDICAYFYFCGFSEIGTVLAFKNGIKDKQMEDRWRTGEAAKQSRQSAGEQRKKAMPVGGVQPFKGKNKKKQ